MFFLFFIFKASLKLKYKIFFFDNFQLFDLYYMDDIEINIENEIVSFEDDSDSNLNKCIIYTFIFFILILFGLLLFVIILMIYNYLVAVFI
jgi:hypothetical protein